VVPEIRDFLASLGFVLAIDNCARGCRHCPAFGSTLPVERAKIEVLETRLISLQAAYALNAIPAPTRVLHCWRISDPLDYAVRSRDGVVVTCADLAALWSSIWGQGLYVVTNGSEGKPTSRRAIREMADDPGRLSQIKITITPADLAWNEPGYVENLADDVRVLAALWDLPSTRQEDVAGRRFRINLKTTVTQRDEGYAVVRSVLEAAGFGSGEVRAILDDPTRVSAKDIYDLRPDTTSPSPVPGSINIKGVAGNEYKATPEARDRYQYGIRPDGRIFLADMYRFSESDLVDDKGSALVWRDELRDLDRRLTVA